MTADRHWPFLVRLRLASGVVLFAFLVTHFANSALGLVSLAAMHRGAGWLHEPWRTPPLTVLLYGALVTHVVLTITALVRRRTWRGVRAHEWAQAAVGLALPPLLVSHILVNRGLQEVHGFNETYAYNLLVYWLFDPLTGVQQATLALLAWGHGCLGLHLWLRFKPWYARSQPYLYALALLWPAFALLGMAQGAREAIVLYQSDPAFGVWLQQENRLPTEAMGVWVFALRDGAHYGMAGLALLLVGVRAARGLVGRARRTIVLRYPMNREVRVAPGAMTLLEASRQTGIPHASVCGGRGRCSTCRVRLGPGADLLPPPSDDEQRVLNRIGAPPNVRLACQIRPVADLSVAPLLPPIQPPSAAFGQADYAHGADREIAVLFADLRAFTSFAESRLPYDVVFVINEYSRRMGEAVEAAGGRVDKFIGDGVMALFGVEGGAEDGARRALDAARRMAAALREINRTLEHDLPAPLRMGIGIHVGPAIIGQMGYGAATHLTAIGDTVNTASRLESATKEFGAELVFSQAVAERAGFAAAGARRERLTVRGRDEVMEVIVVADATTLSRQ